MIKICHRGNQNGQNPNKENHPDYINEALKAGYFVEIDVWHINNKYILGHDQPQYEIDKDFLLNYRFWHHAKNIEAICKLNMLRPKHLINCFFHDTDPYTLTSQGWIWSYPGQPIIDYQQIVVMPERIQEPYDFSKAGGICSDYID